MWLRQLVSIAVLPFTVTVLVPVWIAGRRGLGFAPIASPTDVALVAVGALVAAAGLGLFGWCLVLFWTRGKGTLAPWDPPRRFVVSGPYRYVRNPMITGVLLVLVGEACLVRAVELAEWAATFAVINAIYIPMTEEPILEARFGGEYRAYCEAVPRFVPRVTPWQGAP
jgi:protein-S-isoprenylcysteine O-methyltransferase Ste14